MRSQLIAYLRRHHLALVALFVALGGTSYAAARLPRDSVGTAQLKPNAVTSAKVKNRSLLAKDFKPGQLRPGPAGLRGPAGARGPAGPRGTVDTSQFFTKGQSDARYVQAQSTAAQHGSLFLDGTLRTTGALRLGSETGTTFGPRYPSGSSGLVIRRISSLGGPGGGQVVARVGPATFERDGSSVVAFRLNDSAGTGDVQMDCTGVTLGGAGLVKRATVTAGTSALVFSGADAADALSCSFLYNDGGTALPQTQVIIQNVTNVGLWFGTVISTDDQ
jgi:hypothetical protein